ncbi:MAG: hypothetical protein IJ019_02370 [Alphaproteobacteria bacterium]|nr:hypothetical protein [Alphaproteobacteria bacterium]
MSLDYDIEEDRKYYRKQMSIVLKQMMKIKNVTVEEFAKTLNISEKQACDFIEGKKLPDIYMFLKIHKRYDIYLNDVLPMKFFDTNIDFSRIALESGIIASLKYLPEYVLNNLLDQVEKHGLSLIRVIRR